MKGGEKMIERKTPTTTLEGLISRLVAKTENLERENRKLKNKANSDDTEYYKTIQNFVDLARRMSGD